MGWILPCNTSVGDLNFTIAGQQFRVPAEELVVLFRIPGYAEYCKSAIDVSSSSSDNVSAIFFSYGRKTKSLEATFDANVCFFLPLYCLSLFCARIWLTGLDIGRVVFEERVQCVWLPEPDNWVCSAVEYLQHLVQHYLTPQPVQPSSGTGE